MPDNFVDIYGLLPSEAEEQVEIFAIAAQEQELAEFGLSLEEAVDLRFSS